MRAVDQGRQRRDQVDAAVVPDVCRQCRSAPASCARLQSLQFPAYAGDTRADQGLVADELERKADQDRREGREPRPLCRLPDGRGRHPTANVPGGSAANCGTAAAATTSASMRRSIVMRSRATNGTSALKWQNVWPDWPLERHSDAMERRELTPVQVPAFQQSRKSLPFNKTGEPSGESRLISVCTHSRAAPA